MQSPPKSIDDRNSPPASVPELVAEIGAEIERRGPMTFARFIELALYHPAHGYYSSGRAQIGRGGDYITNVSVGPVFGALLAAQFAEVWELLDRPKPFTIVEQGAHDGTFAADVLAALERQSPSCSGAIDYRIVEPFAAWRQKQRERLGRAATWCSSLDELAPFTGVHFSNELFDSLPVHIISRNERGWHERFVALSRGGELTFVEQPLSSTSMEKSAAAFDDLPIGSEIEVCFAASDLMAAIANKLTRGVILVGDYGYETPVATGTLQVRARHRLLSSSLISIGAADITAHVDWKRIVKAAAASGLTSHRFADQHHFVSGILTRLWRAQFAEANDSTRRQLQTLLQPALLGRAFQFAAFMRDMPADGQLSGFAFAMRSDSPARAQVTG